MGTIPSIEASESSEFGEEKEELLIQRFSETGTSSEMMDKEPILPQANWYKQEFWSHGILLVTKTSANF